MPWAPNYADVDELASYRGVPDSIDDAVLALCVAGGSRAVDRLTRRQFGQVAAPELRHYSARWNRRRCRWVVEIDDLQNVAGLTVTIKAATVTFTLEPIDAAAKGRPYERLVIDPLSVGKPADVDYEVDTTARWGWNAVPDPVKGATLMQAARFAMRRQAPFGIAGSPDTGSEMRLLAKIDPDVAVDLADYRRDRVLIR